MSEGIRSGRYVLHMTIAPEHGSPEILGVSGMQRRAARGTVRSILAMILFS